jgi:NhaA family Na+:H+ antiporter
MRLYAPWEKAFHKIATPFEHFIHAQTTSGFVLMAMTVLALIIANSPLYETYLHIIHTTIEFNVGSWKLSHSLHHWINDGLMAIFFFMVGLEIKREILVGELSSIKVAILPILSAIGGMIVPALIYLVLNANTPYANGWGIPMATDIAFAISALILLGKRVSPALVTFLVALAIVDDLGAVGVIAFFYTDTIHFTPLILAGATLLIMILFNRFGIRATLPYLLFGIILWFFMLESGVHATIAGVLAAMTIPSKPHLAPIAFTDKTRNLLESFDKYPITTDHVMHENQKAILQNIKDNIDAVISPANRMEHTLHLPVSLVILPIFALANAGVNIDVSSLSEAFSSPITLGIIFGLVLGKIIGITGVAYLAIKLKIAKLPQSSSMGQLFGVGALGGIGFTMSIFVADLAFVGDESAIYAAKIGILTASLFAGILGYLWLYFIPVSKKH